jgi:diguanylate cyclase (GGDEF)-like protein
MRVPLVLFRSFRSRILALVLGLVTAVLLATVTAVVLKARDAVNREAATQLQTAAETARQVLTFRGNQLASAAEVLTSDFGFKEAVASGDNATLLSAMGNHRNRIGADVVIVLDRNGGLVASTVSGLSANTLADLEALVVSDPDGELLRLYRLIDGKPYQLVLAPVLAPDPIAWTAMGFALDDRVAREMAGLLGVEVSFVSGEREQPIYVASSLPVSERTMLGDAASRPAAVPFSKHAGSDDFLTWTNPIRSANGSLTVVLQRSLTGALRPYAQLRGSIVAIGLVILGLASVLAALLARSATRPVDELTRAAERLEAGDYESEVPRAGPTELCRLASAFNAMRAAVAERERTILHQASHDSLTGLPTRSRVTDILDECLVVARRDNTPVAVCLIEIQQLENIVGSFGHAAADEVVCEVARRLTADGEVENRVARMGTDQFLLILDGADAAHARRQAEVIARQLRAPFEYREVSLQLDTHIGVALFPEDAVRASQLLQCAELAHFRAKESGLIVGTFVRGDDEVQRQRLSVLGDLRRAIAADELELYYQPKVALPSGQVVGCEALIRWRHPKKGFIPPSDFIPHAERTGLIRAVTKWVVGTAFRQARSWQAAGLNFDVSINVSAMDLADPRFAERVAAMLTETGANPARIVLEVTESAAMKDLTKTLPVMEHLRILGLRFSIDDFGTGYSSLAHLKRLPVSEIKIDRSFVQGLETRQDDDVIVRSTIELGHALKLKVVAEGVEVPYSWNTLEGLGCDLVQGYFVAKPMPVAEFSSWVISRLPNGLSGATSAMFAETQVIPRSLDSGPPTNYDVRDWALHGARGVSRRPRS